MEIPKKKEEAILQKTETKKELRFFIVDDDEYFNNLVKSYIKKIGDENNFNAEIESYTDGAQCIEHITDNPDYVILDFYLDENNDIILTGYDVLEQIHQYNERIEVIIISQKHEWANFEDEFKKFGALGFLKKDNQLFNNLQSMIVNNNIALS